MTYLRLFIYAGLLTAIPFCAHSQSIKTDSTYMLAPVNISANRLSDFSIGISKTKFDSTLLNIYSAATLSELLADQSSIYIKNYGVGSTATISFRGSGASHTGVFWNGVPVNGPMMGLSDFSLLPVFMIGSVEVQHGGAGTLYGSGVIGGSIHLNSDPVFESKIRTSLQQSIGSYGNYLTGFSSTYGNSKWQGSSKIMHHQSKNNFPFINTAEYGAPLRTQSNAALARYGLVQEIHYKPTSSQVFSARAWYQHSNRQIPPAMTMGTNKSFQNDYSLRLLLQYKKISEKGSVNVRSSLIRDNIQYVDSLLILNQQTKEFLKSESNSYNSFTELEIKRDMGKNIVFNAGGNVTYFNAFTASYSQPQKQLRTALFTSLIIKSTSSKWKGVLGLRQEFLTGYHVPFVPSVGFEGSLIKHLHINGNVSKNYRIPTLNDRYWVPGGNPDLTPENGWSEELGLCLKSEENPGKFTYILSTTLYNSIVENWILWVPNSNGIWSPENLNKVWSRGWENSGKITLHHNDWNFNFSGSYTFSLSSNEKASSPTDVTAGRQLIYVPYENAQVFVKTDYKNITFGYNQTYTGARYTLSDNSKFLPPYSLGNIIVSKVFKFSTNNLNIQFQAKNIFNVSYQTIEWRAMPGRNYLITLSLNINK